MIFHLYHLAAHRGRRARVVIIDAYADHRVSILRVFLKRERAQPVRQGRIAGFNGGLRERLGDLDRPKVSIALPGQVLAGDINVPIGIRDARGLRVRRAGRNE